MDSRLRLSHLTGSLNILYYYGHWNTCNPSRMSHEGRYVWQLRRVKAAPAKFVHARMYALWYLWLAWDATHLSSCMASQADHNNHSICSKICLPLSRMHACNVSRRLWALRPQDVGTGMPLPEIEKFQAKKNCQKLGRQCSVEHENCFFRDFCSVLDFVKRFFGDTTTGRTKT